MQISSCLADDIAFRLLGRPLPESEGRWQATVWTAADSDSGTKDSVLVVLYGTTGHSEPKPLNKDSAFNQGSMVSTQVCIQFSFISLFLSPSLPTAISVTDRSVKTYGLKRFPD